MTETAYAWAPITKVEDQDDGTVMVYGPAADAGVDRDKQRLNQKWLDEALPQWLAEGGNVREQHDKLRAVGRGVGLTRGADGAHLLAAHVVDPVAVKKVKTNVLQGFSINIKEPRVEFGKADAPNGEIVGGTIPEVSLVDRPANPRTYFTMVKSDNGGELAPVDDPEVVEVDEDEADEADVDKADTGLMPMYGDDLLKFVSAASRKRMAASGVAMDNGDFPIPDEGHLQSAIGLLGGYSGDKAAAKAHIISRARALGLTSMLPDDWGVSKADAILAEVRSLVPNLEKADSDVATAQQAIACIANLICSEATTMGAGRLSDAYDIKCLLDAVCALKYFIACESADTAQGQNQNGEVAMQTDGTLTDGGGSMDVAGAAYDTSGLKADAPADDVSKVDMSAFGAIVEAAITKAAQASEGRFAAIEAQLTKVLAMPEPGGPVAMRTASQAAAARGVDAVNLRRQAAEFIARADDLSREDPTAARGYRDRAAELLAKADA